MSNKYLIILPHIKIHNANALSSPFTIGFPAMTAWLGFSHALQRKLNQHGYDELKFIGTGIVNHDFNLQTYKGEGDFVQSIIGTGNPLEPKSDKGKPEGNAVRPSFIEEARCHLEVTLVIEWEGNEEEIEDDDPEAFLQLVIKLLTTMKIAGGDILEFVEPRTEVVDDEEETQIKALTRTLMPGYTLIERRELMQEAMTGENGLDALDVLLSYLTINHSCEQNENEEVTWNSKRKTAGWIVPIATGFHGISNLGKAKNQRDPEMPHRFAESIVTLGEFVMPHRIEKLDDMLWHYHINLEENLYICQQNSQKQN